MPKKLGKKGKTTAKPEQPKQEPVKETPKQQEKLPEVEQKTSNLDDATKAFVENRKVNHPAPTFKNVTPPPLGAYTRPTFAPPPRPVIKKEEGSIADQINNLSPELKAIIMSGALERKNFDDDNT